MAKEPGVDEGADCDEHAGAVMADLSLAIVRGVARINGLVSSLRS